MNNSPQKGVMSSFYQKRQVDDDEVNDEDDEIESDT